VKFKATTSRMVRNGSAGLMANNFLKNLDAGLLIDRTQPSTKKNAKKRTAAPNALLKYSRPRPTALDDTARVTKG